jgi:hypothetical protein
MHTYATVSKLARITVVSIRAFPWSEPGSYHCYMPLDAILKSSRLILPAHVTKPAYYEVT